MIFDFVFNTIGLNKLTSIVYAANAHAQKSTLALGFKQEGFFKNHLYDPKLKTWVDTHQNALLIEEFKSNARLAKFSARLLSATHTTPESDSLFGRLDAASF
jgi:diamine N-acetyltransferase